MREAEKYYDNTEGLEPNYVIGEFLKLGVMPGSFGAWMWCWERYGLLD